MVAWVLRFGFFGLGGPAFPGVTLFILSCVVYGVAFYFFNVSGGLFVDAACSEDVKASAQGLFMLMTNSGSDIIDAVVNYPKTDYLYFFSDLQQEFHFAKDYDEFVKLQKQYPWK